MRRPSRSTGRAGNAGAVQKQVHQVLAVVLVELVVEENHSAKRRADERIDDEVEVDVVADLSVGLCDLQLVLHAGVFRADDDLADELTELRARSHVRKDVEPKDVEVSCAKAGFRQTRVYRRTSADAQARVIETECTLQRL